MSFWFLRDWLCLFIGLKVLLYKTANYNAMGVNYSMFPLFHHLISYFNNSSKKGKQLQVRIIELYDQKVLADHLV